MNSWRDTILNEFFPNVSKLTLVADPDCLLTEEKMAIELRSRGFDLIEFTDSVEFRYAYESKYRSIWDRGEHTDLIVILRLQDSEIDSLPFDLLQAGRKLSFNLGDLFPNLSYPVIEKLDRSLLDLLFEAQRKFSPDRMGDNATKDFILQHVFGIATNLVVDSVSLLRVLLRMHYGNLQIPPMLSERLIQLFGYCDSFANWPLVAIVTDEEAFYAFLQERWPIFLSRFNSVENQAHEQFQPYGLIYSGPNELPFDHQDIKVYIDNLFLEGKLRPIEANHDNIAAGSWVLTGIVSGKDNVHVRITRLFELVEKTFPTNDARHSDWITFALKWAELSSLVFCSQNAEAISQLRQYGVSLNKTFSDWISSHYASLINLPPTIPAMLHHVPRRLAREMEEVGSGRAALIVMDGLALDQWVTIRQILEKQLTSVSVRESATFAWIPTITSVSRQALFAGKPPMYFPATIATTNSEEKLWKQQWEGHGLSKLDVAYQRGLGDGNASDVLDSVVHPGKTRVVGLVIDKVDKIMHGMQLGSAGMHNQIKQWGEGRFLADMISKLLDYNFTVWLTADHGNIQCEGKGRPTEGVIAETKGERVRVYPTEELRSKTAKAFPFAQEWQPVGLPDSYYPLLASGHDAFVTSGDSLVGHGGLAIEEVVVPLIKFERKSA